MAQAAKSHEETAVVTVLRVLQDDMDWEYIIKCWIDAEDSLEL